MNNGKTLPLIVLCEKSYDLESQQAIITCLKTIFSVANAKNDDYTTIKAALYTYSSDITKNHDRLKQVVDIDYEKQILSNNIDITTVYNKLVHDLSRSSLLAGELGYYMPCIIMIADGSSNYTQNKEKIQEYFSENKWVRAARKFVFYAGSPSNETINVFETFTGNHDMVMCTLNSSINDVIDTAIDTITHRVSTGSITSTLGLISGPELYPHFGNDLVSVDPVIDDSESDWNDNNDTSEWE